MSGNTLIPEDKKQTEGYDIDRHYADQLANKLSESERTPGSINMDEFENKFNNSNKRLESSKSEEYERSRRRESNGATGSPTENGSWTDNVTEGGLKKSQKKGWFKKASPALGLGGIFGVGSFALIGLTSPSLLIVQMKEIMTEKFNTQLTTMDARSNKLLVSKIHSSTSGYCGSKVTIKCKFTTMSEKQVKKLATAGIEVKGDPGIGKRVKPTSLIFNGKEISPNDFSKIAAQDTKFRSALKQAYNPKYAGFTGKAWSKVAARFKINKQLPDLGADEDKEKARSKLNQIAKEGTDDKGARTRTASADGCEGNSCLSEEDANNINDKDQELDGTTDSAGAEVRARLSGIGVSAATNFFKVTGPVDSACQVYGALTTLSYAAKAIRAAQLVRYGMVFFSVADGIKGGTSPKPEDVAFLGSIATTIIKNPDDPSITDVGSATDSFGYKYAAYGDTGGPEKSMKIANRFMSGGGFVGELSGVTNTVLNFIPGGREGAKNTCKVLGNPIVQGASIVVGIATLFIPGAPIAKAGLSTAAGVAMSVATAVLPGLLADIVAGTVTENIVGEESGNAITSGAGALMSDALAAENGNGPLSKQDATQFALVHKETTNRYIADELQTTSPFDASNPNTFLGSISNTLFNVQSNSNPLTKLSSLLSLSLSSIIPQSSALTTEQYQKSLELCQDMDIKDAGYAADPFCNVIRGIPIKYLDKDPLLVIDELKDELSVDGKPMGNYANFIKKCISMSQPLGYSEPDSGYSATEAQSCIVNDSNINYYLNYVDQRVDLGLSDEDTVNGSASSTAGIEIDRENLFVDSTTIGCAVGTDFVRDDDGYMDGNKIPVKLCSIPNTSEDGAPMLINSRASGAVAAMIEKMRADLGISTVKIASSFRVMSQQQHAWDCNHGNPGNENCSDIAGAAARPGYSNHQMGYAIDFQLPTGNSGSSKPGDPMWDWLNANATTYGFSSNVGESWHWSVTGG